MFRRRLVLLVVAIALAVQSTAARAAENILSFVPEDALGFLIVNDLATVSNHAEVLARTFQTPLPSPLAMLKMRTGIQEGLDKNGRLMVAMLAGDQGIKDPTIVAAIPVSDYAAFVEQFDGSATEEITAVTLGGEEVLLANKGAYALAAPKGHRELLQKMLQTSGKTPSALTSMASWLGETHVAAVMLPAGVKLALAQAIEGMDEAKKGMEDSDDLFGDPPGGGAQVEQARAALDLYANFFKIAQEEISSAAAGIQVTDAGDVRLGARAQLKDGSQHTKLASSESANRGSLLAGLPGGPFVAAGGVRWSPTWTKTLTQWSVDMMKLTPQMYGSDELDEEDLKKLIEATEISMKGIKSFHLHMGVGEEDAPLYSNVTMLMKVENASEYLENYKKSLELTMELYQQDEETPLKVDVSEVTLADRKASKVSMDISKIMAAQAQGVPQMQQMMQQMAEMMFGKDGKITFYLVELDKTTALAFIGTEEQVLDAIKKSRLNDTMAASDSEVAETTALLPSNPDAVIYLSPRGMVNWVRRMVSLMPFGPGADGIPEFPETPPLGFSAQFTEKGLAADAVVPGSVLEALKKYIEEAR